MSIVKEIREALAIQNVIGVDLEYYGVARGATLLSLIQLSTVNADYIIDSLCLRDQSYYCELRKIFADP
jgi:ribonuclease D